MEASQLTTPSKVLHFRNLPPDTTGEELVELCSPFGALAQTRLHIGPNRNQAFVEFADINAAMSMATHYSDSAEPAKVRGKTVYCQYSLRQEITQSRGSDAASNVLLIAVENLAPNVPFTIDTLHLVFNAFGQGVQKIATFEKGTGLQALIQYGDVETAEAVRAALDGRLVPAHLLGSVPNPPTLKVNFSQHTDLNVKFQSHRSRDYTNPHLPSSLSVYPSLAPAAGRLGASAGMPLESNVLLCGVDNQAYPVTVDALHQVFSPYGFVQKIAVFDKNGTSQALVQYPDTHSAANAKAALEGHAIYDGGYNRLKLSYSVHRELNVKTNSERSWDYTAPVQAPTAGATGPADAHASHGNGLHGHGGGHGGGGHGGGHSSHGGGHGRGGHEEPVIVTGADYEAAHDGIARAANNAAAAQRGPRGHGGRPAYQQPVQQSYQAPPSYQPQPVYGGQPAPQQQQQYYAPAQQAPVYTQPAPQAPAMQTYQAAPAPQAYQAAPAPQAYQAAPAPQAYQAAPAAQQYQPAQQPVQYAAPQQQPQQHYAPAAPTYAQQQPQPGAQYSAAPVIQAQPQAGAPAPQPVAAPQSGYVQQF